MGQTRERMDPRRAGAGAVTGLPLVLLRSEGLALLVMAVALYARSDSSWLLFAILFLAPDLGMLGYVKNTRLGALTYDLLHTYVPPAALGLAGVGLDVDWMAAVALIWFAHIGADRMLGYGLKYPTSFGHTHLGVIGRAER